MASGFCCRRLIHLLAIPVRLPELRSIVQYGFPYGMGGSAMVFVYNRDHFQEVGLKEPSADWKNPWTWEDYRQAAIRLTKRNGDAITRAGAEQIGNFANSVPTIWGGTWLKDHQTAGSRSPEHMACHT